MSRLRYKPTVWVPCKCPACGHEQEAEEKHLMERGASCEHCGEPTREKNDEHR